MVTVGYGDITPTSTIELLLATISILIACGMFAFSLNKMGSIL